MNASSFYVNNLDQKTFPLKSPDRVVLPKRGAYSTPHFDQVKH